MPKFGPTSTNMPAIAVASPTRKVGVTFCFQRTHPARVTKMGARFASSVEFATDVHTIDQCQTPRSRAKKSPAAQTAGESRGAEGGGAEGRGVFASQSHKNGTASATLQNALATGPVSDRRTKMGANAMAQPPASRHRKAPVDARSLTGCDNTEMSKAFTREQDAPEDDFDGDDEPNPIPPGSKNYLTPLGWQRMRDELKWLVNLERPE